MADSEAAGSTSAPDAVDVVVVGGGIAGLTAAITAAEAGRNVVVLEARDVAGGRAKSAAFAGATFDAGPHALYRSGAGMKILRELGIDPSGSEPQGPQMAHDERGLHRLPSGVGTLLTTTYLSSADKAAFGWFFSNLGRIPAEKYDSSTVNEMIDALTSRQRVAALMRALSRLTSYSADLDLASGGAALRQLQMVVTDNVLYLDNGWQQLIDALVGRAERAGVSVRTGCEVRSAVRNDDSLVVTSDQQTLEARCVVLATPPAVADRLACSGETLQKTAGPPVTAAVLDVVAGLVPKTRFILGVEHPTYASVVGPPAARVKAGSAAIVCARYLADGEQHDANNTANQLREQRRLLGVEDSSVVDERYLHRLTVTGGQPLASVGGFAGRPTINSTLDDRLLIAGDWVGPTGLLADAAFASGRDAGRAAASVAG